MPDPMKAETAPNGLPTRADGGRAFPFRSLEKGDPIMKRIFWPALLPLLLLAAADVLPAQQQRDEEACVVTVKGENRNRTVAGVINQECGVGGIVFRRFSHSAPWGNWGVSSNYGGKEDTDQFRGWKWEDGPRTKLQWNSCTSGFPPPDRRYYNASNFRTQSSSATVTHGTYSYRTNVVSCQQAYTEGEPLSGCSGLAGTSVVESENYMTLYELDWDASDLVETLYFPRTSIRLRNCNRHDCPEQTTSWVGVTRDTSTTAQVDAQLRMKASATLIGYCGEPEDWDSN